MKVILEKKKKKRPIQQSPLLSLQAHCRERELARKKREESLSSFAILHKRPITVSS